MVPWACVVERVCTSYCLVLSARAYSRVNPTGFCGVFYNSAAGGSLFLDDRDLAVAFDDGIGDLLHRLDALAIEFEDSAQARSPRSQRSW